MIKLRRIEGGAYEDLVLGGRTVATALGKPFEVTEDEASKHNLVGDARFRVYDEEVAVPPPPKPRRTHTGGEV